MASYEIYVGKGHERVEELFNKLRLKKELSKFIIDLVEKNLT